MIDFWKRKKLDFPLLKNKSIFANKIFPSSRQSITHILSLYGLGRSSLVATPEWASHCLISSIGKLCQPISIKIVIKNKINVDAFILYNQYGWENISSINFEKNLLFKNKLLIFDRVDDTNIFSERKKNIYKIKSYSSNVFEIFSLSKTIGLKSGALVRNSGKFINYNESRYKKNIIKKYDKVPYSANNLNFFNKSNFMKLDYFNEIFKSYSPFLHKLDKRWIQKNDIKKAYNFEYTSRRKNFELILSSQLSKRWPNWMKKTINYNIVPNAVPIFVEKSNKELEKVNKIINSRFKTVSQIYHFDWNCSFIKPNYKKCILLPIHSEVKKIKEIINFFKIQ